MAITCPRCGSEYDATLFQYGHRVRCACGAEIEYPGENQQAGHVAAREHKLDKPCYEAASGDGGESDTAFRP